MKTPVAAVTVSMVVHADPSGDISTSIVPSPNPLVPTRYVRSAAEKVERSTRRTTPYPVSNRLRSPRETWTWPLPGPSLSPSSCQSLAQGSEPSLLENEATSKSSRMLSIEDAG